MPDDTPTLLPLFPLANVVHFPDTELPLHILEPRYRVLVRDLEARRAAGEPALVGMAVSRPGERDTAGRTAVFAAGTAGRLVAIEPLADGRYDIVLRGEFRFTLEREGEARPYRTAIVRPHPEAPIDDAEPVVRAVREELITHLEALAAEMGGNFPLDRERLARLAATGSFAALINNLAAELDLPVSRKLLLLDQTLPERALDVLTVLRSRRRVLDLLRPFRHLAHRAERN